jgi:hypothetical protein
MDKIIKEKGIKSADSRLCHIIFYSTKIINIFYGFGVQKLLFGSKLWLLPNYGNASKFSYLKNFNN